MQCKGHPSTNLETHYHRPYYILLAKESYLDYFSRSN